jgi:hypothetical protein
MNIENKQTCHSPYKIIIIIIIIIIINIENKQTKKIFLTMVTKKGHYRNLTEKKNHVISLNKKK